jgi:hypothetical protein
MRAKSTLKGKSTTTEKPAPVFKLHGISNDGFAMKEADNSVSPCPLSKDARAAQRIVNLIGFPVAAPSEQVEFPEMIPKMVAFAIWRAASNHGLDASVIIDEGGDFNNMAKTDTKFSDYEWIGFCQFLSKERDRTDRRSAWIHQIQK